VEDLAEFRAHAGEWLDANEAQAPPDYGPILPPDLVGSAVEWQKRLYDSGFAGIHWPVAHGGRGLSPAHHDAWLAECSARDVAPFVNMVGFVLAGQGVQQWGTDDQKVEHLRPIITADRIWCQLFSEPGAGSDLSSLRTSAEADGDSWVVNGQKVWCSGGHYSDWGILMARTGPDRPRHQGISFFLVEMSTPGIETRPLRQMTGESEFDEVFLTDARLPKSALLGPVHDGWRVGMSILMHERSSIGTAAETMVRRLDQTIDRNEPARPVDRQDLMRLYAAAMGIRGVARGQDEASNGSSLLKLGITEAEFAKAMIDGAGRPDAMLDSEASRAILAAPGGKIAGGTSQIQRNIIGERLLGLPRDPAPRPREDSP